MYDIKKSAHCCWACWCLPDAPAADQLYQSQKPEAKHKADRHQPQPVRYRIQTHMYPGQLMEPVVHFPKAHPGAVGADGLHADPAHRKSRKWLSENQCWGIPCRIPTWTPPSGIHTGQSPAPPGSCPAAFAAPVIFREIPSCTYFENTSVKYPEGETGSPAAVRCWVSPIT